MKWLLIWFCSKSVYFGDDEGKQTQQTGNRERKKKHRSIKHYRVIAAFSVWNVFRRLFLLVLFQKEGYGLASVKHFTVGFYANVSLIEMLQNTFNVSHRFQHRHSIFSMPDVAFSAVIIHYGCHTPKKETTSHQITQQFQQKYWLKLLHIQLYYSMSSECFFAIFQYGNRCVLFRCFVPIYWFRFFGLCLHTHILIHATYTWFDTTKLMIEKQ